ncbi:MAG: acyltransferase, partial [Desulfobacterales bacterium]|nr:acyltransferase [Desulfobacterales bacterium]
AVLWVVFGHMSNRDLLSIDMKYCAVYGVYLFFVFSEFLITLPFLVHQNDRLKMAMTWKKFFMRRVLRIYPAYMTVLLFYLVLSTGFGLIPRSSEVYYDLLGVLRHLALLDGQSLHWTIPVEMRFYMVVPVVIGLTAILSTRLHGKALLIAAFVVMLLMVQYFLSLMTDGLSMLFYLPVFLLGVLTCVAHLIVRDAGNRKGKLLYNAAGWLSFFLVVMTIPSVWKASGFQEVDFKRFPIIHGVMWSCMLFCALKGGGSLSRAFSIRALRYIGVISFSMYLWHMPVIFFVKKTPMVEWPVFYQFGFVVIVTLLVASFSYLWIERPFLLGRPAAVIHGKLGLNLDTGTTDSGNPGLRIAANREDFKEQRGEGQGVLFDPGIRCDAERS